MHIYQLETRPLVPTAEFCASPKDNINTLTTALPSVSLSLGLSLSRSPMAISILHWCLVRSRHFAGMGRFLTGLFTFLNRWPVINRLSYKKELITDLFCFFNPKFLCFLDCNIMLSSKMWLFLHAVSNQILQSQVEAMMTLGHISHQQPLKIKK